ncbi:hypothetical protein FRB94_009939 [Tulasnella sp. JGI-2019a]|nr:hypothetical protein FRB94_009939 [Tulasnella sp. JGI-2019a]KAG9038162.1 hypothetical protein FRB95_002602 [Tulasnella sp. JGI-2019a]
MEIPPFRTGPTYDPGEEVVKPEGVNLLAGPNSGVWSLPTALSLKSLRTYDQPVTPDFQHLLHTNIKSPKTIQGQYRYYKTALLMAQSTVYWNSSQVTYSSKETGQYGLNTSTYLSQSGCNPPQYDNCGGWQLICDPGDTATLVFWGTSITVNFIRYASEIVVKTALDGVYLPTTFDVSNPQDGTTDPYAGTGCTLASLTKSGLSATTSHNISISQGNNIYAGFLLQSFAYNPSPNAPKATSSSSLPVFSSTTGQPLSTAASAITAATTTATTAPSRADSKAPVIGGVIGALVLAILVVFITWFCVRRKMLRRRGLGVLDADLRNSLAGSNEGKPLDGPPTPVPRIAYGLPVSYMIEDLPRAAGREPNHPIGPSETGTGQYNLELATARDTDNLIRQTSGNNLPHGAATPVLRSSNRDFEASTTSPDPEHVVQRLLTQGVPLPQIASFIGMINRENGTPTPGQGGRADMGSPSDAGTAPPTYDRPPDRKSKLHL